MPFNAASAYQNNRIATASKGELTLMLYEGAIKFCNMAILGLEEKNYSKVNNNIGKVKKIIAYLRATLDFKYPVAKDFENIYVYLNDRLVEANIHKSKEILEVVLGHLRDLRDNWKEIMKNA